MWPITVLSIAATAIILERIIRTSMFHRETNQFLRFIKSRGREGQSFSDISGADLFGMEPDDMETLVEQEIQMSFDGMFKNLEYSPP